MEGDGTKTKNANKENLPISGGNIGHRSLWGPCPIEKNVLALQIDVLISEHVQLIFFG